MNISDIFSHLLEHFSTVPSLLGVCGLTYKILSNISSNWKAQLLENFQIQSLIQIYYKYMQMSMFLIQVFIHLKIYE